MSNSDAIDSLSRSVLTALAELQENAEEMSSQLVDIEQQVSALRNEASQHLLRAKMYVQTRESEAEQSIARLSSEIERVQADAVAELTSNIESTSSSLDKGLDALMKAVVFAKDIGVAKQPQLEAYFGQLEQTRTSFQETIGVSFEASASIAKVVDVYANEAASSIQEMGNISVESVAELRNEVSSISQELQEYVDSEVMELADTRLREISDAVRTLVTQDLVQALEEGGVSFRSFVQDTLMDTFRKLLAELSAVVNEIIESLHDATSGSSAEREALDALIEQIESISEPLTDALDSVRDIASAVGLDI